MIELSVQRESFPLRGTFTISRGSRTVAEVVRVTLSRDGKRGQGEGVPYSRYDETVESVIAAVESLRKPLAEGLDRTALQKALPPGSARNAVDCALWDLEAKEAGCRAWELAGLPEPLDVTTAFTLSLDSPEAMGEAARQNAERPLLKLKLAGPEDLDRVRAVNANAPNSRLIVDANEGWTAEQYEAFAPELKTLGVAMIEQPLPASDDAALAGVQRTVPVCADESCHDRATLSALEGKYDLVNIKLDKTGGLTEALALREEARARGFGIMVGCMVGTSLSMAPAVLVAQGAEFVDLDGPLWMAEDRSPGLVFEGSRMAPSSAALWG